MPTRPGAEASQGRGDSNHKDCAGDLLGGCKGQKKRVLGVLWVGRPCRLLWLLPSEREQREGFEQRRNARQALL